MGSWEIIGCNLNILHMSSVGSKDFIILKIKSGNLSLFSHSVKCLALCDPMDYRPPGSSVHEISQARILEWVAMSSFRGSSRPRDRIHISYIFCIGRWVLYLLSHQGTP